MSSFKVIGGKPLRGSVFLGGAKNSSFKIMIASLLGSSESRLLNFSKIDDVKLVSKIIESLNGKVRQAGERTLYIDPQPVNSFEISSEYGAASRASILFLGPLLARFKKAKVPLPGGDKIGKRPVDRLMAGLEAMGVRFTQTDSYLMAETDGLVGATYRFEKNSHTGTETLIMAAVLAKGTTVLENAAEEPEVDDLITFLNSMGARITRPSSRTIKIEGVEQLQGAIHCIMPDRNEAVSYACAAIATQGDIIVQNARPEHLTAFLQKLDQVNGGYEVGTYGIRFYYKGPIRSTDIETQIHPGFMTDWQPLWATLMCHAQESADNQPPVSVIHETIYESRFQYVKSLVAMGAKIEPFKPEIADPQNFYNFNLTDTLPDHYPAIKIYGNAQFHGGEFTIHDLREGATILLAALTASGETHLHNIEQIERGYESLDDRLRSMGALIERYE
jgi:UDP-N-acetylglucosamine 1-carboxyvinyltransferase